MAKVLFGPIVSDARNKAVNSVFSKSRFGNYVRNRAIPTQPRTDAQNAVRSNFTSLSRSWTSVLTQLQRDAWIAFAAAHPVRDVFGNSQVLTGLQMYESLNRNLDTIGVAAISDPPADLGVGAPGATVLTAPAGALTLTPDVDPAAGEVPVVFAAAPQSAGRLFTGNKYRFIFKAAAATAGPYLLNTTYQARFGVPASGQRVSVALAYINNATGARSLNATATIIMP